MAASEPVDSDPSAHLNPTQQDILAFLRDRCETQTYFKSRLIGDELGFSSKKVGINMTKLVNTEFADITIEKWGFSNATTWKVTTP